MLDDIFTAHQNYWLAEVRDPYSSSCAAKNNAHNPFRHEGYLLAGRARSRLQARRRTFLGHINYWLKELAQPMAPAGTWHPAHST